MKKKGMFNVSLMTILTALIIFIMLTFGYDIIKSNFSRQCSTKVDIFGEEIRAAVDETAHKSGSVEEYEQKGLCDVEIIYFVDKNKEINATMFSEMPEIMDNVNSSSSDNIFLIALISLFLSTK